MLGKLGWDAIPTSPVTLGAAVGIALGGLAVIGLLTYTKRWTWLWKEWLTTLDPKKIGIMYFIVAFLMLVRGISDAVMIRAQQAIFAGNPNSPFDPDMFQQVFSAHGTIMIFFVAMGVMFAAINLIVPLQIGARDVAFPLLNSISFWLFVAGMILVNISLAIGDFSPAGWLAYPPLSELGYSPGVGVDYWIWALQVSGIGSLLSGVNFLITIFTMRRPGMTLMKMPVFIWSVVTCLVLVVFAFPILTVTLSALALDRTLGMHFFTADFGGNPMMYVNLIWAWGHPEVYILILPAFGVFSEIVPVFSRKRLFGYKSMVVALTCIMLLSYTTWLHHFFTMGAGADVNSFFGLTTMVIAIPTGVKIFNWMFTMFRGKVQFKTPMLWFMGFVVTFTIGGVTGVMLSVPGIDFQVHNSLFLVAHFHNVIIGGVIFAAFAGLTYWWPKFTGFYLHEGLGKAAFWCWFFGFILAFGPLYILGMMGAVRRLDTYDPSLGWGGLFIAAGVGVAVICLGVFFQVLQMGYSYWKRKELAAGPDPWDGRTLEWSTSTPVAEYNFATMTPVKSVDDFWETKKSKSKAKVVEYGDIEVPRNTSYGFLIGMASFVFGFSIVWHIWWLTLVVLLTMITMIIMSTQRTKIYHVIKSRQVAATESKLRGALV